MHSLQNALLSQLFATLGAPDNPHPHCSSSSLAHFVPPSYPAPPSCDLSVTRTRLVRRLSFAVFESPVTRDKDDVFRPSDKNSSRPSPVSCRCFSESSRLRSFTGIIHPPSGTWNRIVAGRARVISTKILLRSGLFT